MFLDRRTFIQGISAAFTSALATKGYTDFEARVEKNPEIGNCINCHFWKFHRIAEYNSPSCKKIGRCWRTCECDETLENFGCVLFMEHDPEWEGMRPEYDYKTVPEWETEEFMWKQNGYPISRVRVTEEYYSRKFERRMKVGLELNMPTMMAGRVEQSGKVVILK